MSKDSSEASNSSEGSSGATLTFPRLEAPNHAPTSFTIILFPGFELLDACGPLDILNHLSISHPDLTLRVASNDLNPVPCKHPSLKDQNPLFSQSIIPTHSYSSLLADEVNPTDVLIIPGGLGSRKPEGSINPTLSFLRSYLTRGLVTHSIFTVCTGSRILAQTGYLDGMQATTNKIAFNTIAELFTKVNWIKRARWVRDGQVWTCSGVTAGMDGMVAFIAVWWSEDVARELCRNLEYRWCGMEKREVDEFADSAG